MTVDLAQQVSTGAVPSNRVVYGRDLLGKGIPIDEEGIVRAVKLIASFDNANKARIEGAERAAGSIQTMLDGIAWINSTIRDLPKGTSPEEHAFWNEELAGHQNQLADLQKEIQSGKALSADLPKIQDALRAQLSKYTGLSLEQLGERAGPNAGGLKSTIHLLR